MWLCLTGLCYILAFFRGERYDAQDKTVRLSLHRTRGSTRRRSARPRQHLILSARAERTGSGLADESQSRRRCGWGGPSPGAGVDGVGPVSAQAWQGCAVSELVLSYRALRFQVAGLGIDEQKVSPLHPTSCNMLHWSTA